MTEGTGGIMLRIKRLTAFVLIVLLALVPLSAVMGMENNTDSSAAAREDDRDDTVRGIWLSYGDYAPLGLSIFDSEAAYRDNADRFLQEASKYGINTVFLHARAFDDAFWRSKTFHASKYIGGNEALSAEEAYAGYDPFGLFLEEAHKYGIKVHAWLNPYRVSRDYYYDPADDASIERVLTAVEELLAFESSGERIDGIHLDDYFYNAGKGYYKEGKPDERYAIVGSEKDRPETGEYVVVTPAEKRENVNRMVKAVYKTVSGAGRSFGISPAANYDLDMESGADIDTWLSEDGYIDYIIPQVYWSNQWGENGDVSMFSDRLEQFLEKRKNQVKFYAGLALYKTDEEESGSYDPGWRKKASNLAEQIKELGEKGADGYVYFSAQFLYRSCAREELSNLSSVLSS